MKIEAHLPEFAELNNDVELRVEDRRKISEALASYNDLSERFDGLANLVVNSQSNKDTYVLQPLGMDYSERGHRWGYFLKVYEQEKIKAIYDIQYSGMYDKGVGFYQSIDINVDGPNRPRIMLDSDSDESHKIDRLLIKIINSQEMSERLEKISNRRVERFERKQNTWPKKIRRNLGQIASGFTSSQS